jgi:hypothetical protein
MLGVGYLHLAELTGSDAQVVDGHMTLERCSLVTRHDGKVQAIQHIGVLRRIKSLGLCWGLSKGCEVLSGLRVRGIDVTALLTPRHQGVKGILDDLVRQGTGMLGLLKGVNEPR